VSSSLDMIYTPAVGTVISANTLATTITDDLTNLGVNATDYSLQVIALGDGSFEIDLTFFDANTQAEVTVDEIAQAIEADYPGGTLVDTDLSAPVEQQAQTLEVSFATVVVGMCALTAMHLL
jgi:hypothetical protein